MNNEMPMTKRDENVPEKLAQRATVVPAVDVFESKDELLILADLPGVKITPVDAYGLNNMQGGQKGMRVRGEVSTHGVCGTVEGLSLGLDLSVRYALALAAATPLRTAPSSVAG